MLKILYEQQNEAIKNGERNRIHNDKSLQDLRDEIEKVKSEHSKQLADLNQKHKNEIDSLKSSHESMKKTIDDMMNRIGLSKQQQEKLLENENEIKSLKTEIENIKSEHSKQLDDLNKGHKNEIDSLKLSHESMKKTIDEMMKKIELNDAKNKENDELIKKLKGEKEDLKSKLSQIEKKKLMWKFKETCYHFNM